MTANKLSILIAKHLKLKKNNATFTLLNKFAFSEFTQSVFNRVDANNANGANKFLISVIRMTFAILAL
jgi:hypothetical protein